MTTLLCKILNLSESSRREIQEDEDWEESFAHSDLECFIRRIKATHIARQIENPAQDMERIRTNGATMRMARKRRALRSRRESKTTNWNAHL